MVKEAYKFGLPPIFAGLLCLIPGWKWAAGVLVFLGLFVFYFFRDPERRIPTEPGAVVSPADGRVVEIVDEPLDGNPGKRVSIFLSIWDVHIQRAPVAGRICDLVYCPGRFLFFFSKSGTTENEMDGVQMNAPGRKLVIQQ